MATFNYPTKYAIAVNIIVIFAGGLGNFLNNYS